MTERKKKKFIPRAFPSESPSKKKNVARRGYGMANETISGCRNVALHCVLKFAKKRMKRSSAFVYVAKRYFWKRCFAFFVLLPPYYH